MANNLYKFKIKIKLIIDYNKARLKFSIMYSFYQPKRKTHKNLFNFSKARTMKSMVLKEKQDNFNNYRKVFKETS